VLQAGRSWDCIPMRWIFSNISNPSGLTIALGSTKPLTEMSTRNLEEKKTRGFYQLVIEHGVAILGKLKSI
jgi:hypothetical protein